MAPNKRLRWKLACLLFLAPAFLSSAAQHPSAPAKHHSSSNVSALPNPLGIDPDIARTIAAIRAIDNHAHPVLPPPLDAFHDNPDRDFDALPVDNMEPQTDPVAWRTSNPQLPEAWAALWNYHGPANPGPDEVKALQAARNQVKAHEKVHYAQWVLDQAGISTMLANRVAMGPASRPESGLAPPAFRWVPYADTLLFPLDNSGLARATPDRAQFFPLEDQLRARYLKDLGLQEVPDTLAAYLSQIVTPTLERQKANGAVAEKFEIAYLRSFDFSDPTQAEAERVYSRWFSQPHPDPADYKLLQDFLFRYIARECGRLSLAVHIHTISGGGSYFNIAGANPLLLEPLFDDVHLRHTRFVLLHGGWPFVREAGALLQKPNVYLDISQQTILFPPRTLAGWLREWLETFPDKVLFGTDGYPYSEVMGWEESTWLATRNGREALGLALTGMLQDGEITRPRAKSIAQDVLRNTAISLYGEAISH